MAHTKCSVYFSYLITFMFNILELTCLKYKEKCKLRHFSFFISKTLAIDGNFIRFG